MDLTILILGLYNTFMIINVGLPAAKEGSEFKKNHDMFAQLPVQAKYSK